MDNNTINNLIHSYIDTIQKQGIPVTSAYIFGSYAKRTTLRKDSDIDVCIVSPAFGNDRVNERVLLMRLREGISDLIEPHPFSEDEMNSKINPFVQEIKKTGVKVE